MSNPQSKPQHHEEESSEDSTSEEELPTLPASRPASVISVPASTKTVTSQRNTTTGSSRVEKKESIKEKESLAKKLRQKLESKPELIPSSSKQYEYEHTPLKPTKMSNHSLKTKTPDQYAGGIPDLERFLTQCRAYFMLESEHYKEPQRQVMFAGMLLTDRPGRWFTPHLKDFLTGKNAGPETQRIFGNFNNFEKALEQLYGTKDKANSNKRQLESLMQKGPAAQYTADFRRLILGTGYNEAALRRCYYRGLKHDLKTELARGDEPDGLEDLIERVHEIDEKFAGLRYENGRTDHRPFTNHKFQKRENRSYEPMDLSATRGPLSPRDREHRMKNNLCLYCGKPGHRARECNVKKGKLAATHHGHTKEEELPMYLKATRGEPMYVNDNDSHDSISGWNLESSDSDGVVREPMLHTPIHERVPTPAVRHEHLSWTACYNDNCLVHLSEKEGSGWYPKPSRPQSTASDSSEEPLIARAGIIRSIDVESDYGTDSDVENNSDYEWCSNKYYFRNDGQQLITPEGRLIYWEQHGEHTILRMTLAQAEVQEDLIENVGTRWIDATKYRFIPPTQAKDYAAQAGSKEQRRNENLLQSTWETNDWHQPEVPILTPASSSTSEEDEQ